jgi:hypothetical protein
MPYKVNLALLSGQLIQLPEIHYAPTPNAGDLITLSIAAGSMRAEVMSVHPIHGVDEVEAQELA